MANPDDFRCLMIGLPRTGKSTYLAALWHVVRSGEVAGSMRLVRREGSQAYLNSLASAWSKCEELDRTPGEGESGIALLLSHPRNNAVVRLDIPDMSGEMYQSHWEFRQCSEGFATMAAECDGCLLFVHPERLVEPSFLVDANLIFSQWEEGNALEPGEDQSEEIVREVSGNLSNVVEWEPKNAPTQVQLIEVLQDLMRLSNRKLRVAIIISAWDLQGDDVTPAKWIETRLPMLWQYLYCNPGHFECNYFGISAQGGGSAEADRLLEYHIASERIKVVYEDYVGSDLTKPIQWLIESSSRDLSVEK